MTPKPAPLPTRSDYGSGCYRRAVRLESEGREVRAELSDDFHHFAVQLRHDGVHAIEVRGEGVRVPWITCPGAVDPLRRMEGAALASPLRTLLRHTDAHAQCTHLHDLACLALAHGARGEAGDATERRYDVAVPDRVDGLTHATLAIDGEPFAAWAVRGLALESVEPAALEGMPLRGAGFHRFLLDVEPELAEATWVFQRAVFIGLGRQYDFDQMEGAWRFEHVVGASCHTFDPARVSEAERIPGSVRDFRDSAGRLFDRD